MGRLISGFFVMGFLIFLATTMNKAWTEPEYGRRGLASVNTTGLPCDGGLNLKVIVNPVDAVAPSMTGIAVETRGAGLGTFRRLHSGEAKDVSTAECKTWQKKFWPLVNEVLSANKNANRSKLVCMNRAEIEYKLGSKSVKDSVCLADARKDKVTAQFKRFFEGTDRLLMH